MAVYRFEETVGVIIKVLEAIGLSDNSLVMLTSDNGVSVPFAKSNCYLNSNKTPWIIKWPGKINGGTVDNKHFISGIDYRATILHALHLPEVPGMDGKSFLPVLKGKQEKEKNVVFTQFNKIFLCAKYPMQCAQEERFGDIVNFWSNGSVKLRQMS
jgi:N-sulfoglucosamine sulfohydrolase